MEKISGNGCSKKYTFYWLDGTREVLEGLSFVDAFREAGYGDDAVAAFDFARGGDDNSYKWNGWKRVHKEE